MKHSGDLIILGGGVIGLTTAYYLAREGVRVILCERGRVGMESSWAGAGILPPSDLACAMHPFDRLRAIGGDLFPDLSAELKERTGIDNGFARSGGLEFLGQIGDADTQEWYGQGIQPEVLSEAEVLRREPALARDLGPAHDVSAMAQLRNPRHLQALRAACLVTNQVTLLENQAVQELIVEQNRVQGVRLADEVVRGDAVVVTAGAWTGRLLEPLGCRLRIEPVRGQIALLHPEKPTIQRILLWGARYLVPRLDGRVLIGSTEEHAGFEKHTTATGVRDLLELGIRLVPALADAILEKTWAGLRPGSPDGLPYIGAVRNFENLFVAAGHFRAGIQLSPGTALLVKQMVLRQPLAMPIDAFRLER